MEGEEEEVDDYSDNFDLNDWIIKVKVYWIKNRKMNWASKFVSGSSFLTMTLARLWGTSLWWIWS